MKIFKKYCYLLFIFFLLYKHSYSGNNIPVFEPDNEVVSFAQKHDRIYFPIFLKALESIRNNDTQLLDEFYYQLNEANPPNETFSLNEHEINVPLIYSGRLNRSVDYTVTLPIDWSDKVHPDKSWRLWFQSLRWLQPYLHTENIDSVLSAFKVIDNWISEHTNYPNTYAMYAFDDHAVAERLETMVMAYHAMIKVGIIDQHFQNRLLLSVLSHLFFVSSLEKYLTWHNHAIIFDIRLLRSLSDFNIFKHRSEFAFLGFSRVFEQYRYSYTHEGVHKEHSPCYHFGFTKSLNQLINLAPVFDYIVPDNILDLQILANEYSYYVNMSPRSLTIGDCAYSTPIISHMDNHVYKPQKHTSWEQSSCSFKFRAFPGSGWAFAFDTISHIHVVMQSDFYSFAHYQQDETSFILNIGEYELIIDPGLHSYNPGEIYDFYRSARAHNLLLVDDKDFEPDFRNNTGLSGITRYFIETLTDTTEVAFIEMTHPHYKRIGVDVYRQFFFPGPHHFTIKDLAYSEQERKYSQIFHLAPDAVIEKNAEGFLISWPHHPYKLDLSTNEHTFEIITGQLNPLQGWYFPAMNQKLPTPVLILNRFAEDVEFITSIEIITPYGCKYQRESNEKNMSALKIFANTMERVELIHQPTPQRWIPSRFD